MKRKVLGIVTAVMIFTGGSMYAFSPLQDKCPDKGTAKCKLVKNCPDKVTSKCMYISVIPGQAYRLKMGQSYR